MKPGSLLAVLASGVLFGFGLALSTMIKPEIVLDFLRWRDFGLLLVLAGAVVVTLITYQLAPRLLARPILAGRFDRHAVFGRRDTLVGAAIFGAGWGFCGVCPGPGIAGIGAANWPLAYAIAGISLGALLQGWFFGRLDDDGTEAAARPPEVSKEETSKEEPSKEEAGTSATS